MRKKKPCKAPRWQNWAISVIYTYQYALHPIVDWIFSDFLDPVVIRPSPLSCFLASTNIESLDASAIEITNYDIANICLFAEVEKYFLLKLEENTGVLKKHIIDHPCLCEKYFYIFHPANKHRFYEPV